jgi:hypothetical protein
MMEEAAKFITMRASICCTPEASKALPPNLHTVGTTRSDLVRNQSSTPLGITPERKAQAFLLTMTYMDARDTGAISKVV